MLIGSEDWEAFSSSELASDGTAIPVFQLHQCSLQSATARCHIDRLSMAGAARCSVSAFLCSLGGGGVCSLLCSFGLCCRCALRVPVFAWAAPFALVAASVVRLGLLSSALAFWGLRVVFLSVFVPPFSVPCAFLVHMLE